jgi:hypothetical protein
MEQPPEQGIERLYYYVGERRRVLGLSRAEMFARGGPSPSTLNKAVGGSRGLSRSTLERLDRALGWVTGSAAAVMQGGTPTSQLPAPTGEQCPGYDHAVAVLESMRVHLRSAERLVDDLLGSTRAR